MWEELNSIIMKLKMMTWTKQQLVIRTASCVVMFKLLIFKYNTDTLYKI